MGEFCAIEEISSFHLDSQQVGHISRNFCQLEGQKYGRKHLVYSDAVRTTGSHSEHNLICSSIDDIFSSILILTSYISCRFIYFIEDLVFRDVGRSSQTFAILSSGQHQRFPCSSCCQYVLEDRSISSCVASDGDSSLRSCKKKVSGLEEDKDVNIPVEVIETNHNILGGPSIFQGLMFPLFGFRLACRIAVACLRYSFLHVRRTQIQIQSLIYRLQRTLHGSSDDIGWLQLASGVLPVEDGTARFMELLRGIRSGEHSLPNSFVYLLIPGLFSNHSPLYFVNTKRFFSKMGLACHIAKIHSEASVDHNAWILKQYIEELYWGSSKRVLLLGHSKGGVDAAAALSLYWSELEDKVAGLALVQSPYGGTPIASDILREGQIADKETRRIMELLICRLIKGDMRALEDLTYEKRKEFIMKHKLPEQIPLVSFHTEASIAPGVLSTMSHIAHAELPWLPLPSFLNEESGSIQAGCKVPVVIPLAAAMAISALHLQLRYGEKSDGLVTCRDAEVPGSVVVKPDRKLDHAWMVYSSKKNNGEPDACEMSEALLTLLVEIGKMKQKQKSPY